MRSKTGAHSSPKLVSSLSDLCLFCKSFKYADCMSDQRQRRNNFLKNGQDQWQKFSIAIYTNYGACRSLRSINKTRGAIGSKRIVHAICTERGIVKSKTVAAGRSKANKSIPTSTSMTWGGWEAHLHELGHHLLHHLVYHVLHFVAGYHLAAS